MIHAGANILEELGPDAALDPLLLCLADWHRDHEGAPCPTTHLQSCFALDRAHLEAFLGLLAAVGYVERVPDGLGAQDATDRGGVGAGGGSMNEQPGPTLSRVPIA